MNTTLVTDLDDEDLSAASDDFSDVDDSTSTDSVFNEPVLNDATNKIPQWQTSPPAQYTLRSGESEYSGYGFHNIYREVVIMYGSMQDRSEPWIRLLRIIPGEFGEPIHGQLMKRPLWDAG